MTGGTQTDGHIIGNADGSIVLNDSNRLTLTSSTDAGTGISMRINNLDKTANVIGLGITTGQTGRTSTTTLNQVYSNLDTDYGSNAYAYVARSTAAHTANGITITGYYTALNNSDAPNGSVYSFYAAGNAPNYFAGLTEHALGVKVSGGGTLTSTSGFNGITFSTGGLFIATDPDDPKAINFVNNGNTQASINTLGRFDNKLAAKKPGSSCIGYQTTGDIGPGVGTSSITAYRSDFGITNAYGDTGVPNTIDGSGYYATTTAGKSTASDSNRSANRLKTYAGFKATGITDAALTTYGFYTDATDTANTNNYGIFSAGTAPNFFRGETFFRNEPNNNNGVRINSARVGIKTEAAYGLLLQRADAGRLLQIATSADANSVKGGISLNSGLTNTTFDAGPGGSHTATSDYRIKQDITPLESAVDVIKALSPVSYKFTNGDPTTYQGFVAHELQEQVAIAVTGTKDAVEPIGTLLDWDGTELETEVTEPEELTYEEQVEATPYVAPAEATYDEYGNELTPAVDEVEATYTTVTRTRSWNPTGTRDVYQGVDQTKLIPLLTKALQEALERIDALEAQLNP